VSDESKVSRRKFLKYAGAGAIAVAAAAAAGTYLTQQPGPSVTTTAGTTTAETSASASTTMQSTAAPVEIKFMNIWTEANNKAGFGQQLALAEAKYPNIKVDNVALEDVEYATAIKTAIASGHAPELMGNCFIGLPNYGEYIEAGGLHPLDQLYEEEGWKSKIFPALWQRQTWKDGHIYGVSVHYDGWVWWADLDILKKAGVKFPDDVSTWDKFLVSCRAIKNAGYYPVAMAGKDVWPLKEYFAYISQTTVGEEDIKKSFSYFGPRKIPFDSPQWVDALTHMVSLVKEGLTNPAIMDLSYDDYWGIWVPQKAAFSYDGNWLPAQTGAIPEWLAFWDGPKIVGKPLIIGDPASFYAISSEKWGNTHITESEDVLRVILSDPGMKLWLKTWGFTSEINENTVENGCAQIYIDIQNHWLASPATLSPCWNYASSVLDTAVSDAMVRALSGTLTPKDAMAEIEKAASAEQGGTISP
jgi:raffinose/stachyose/melibiose transport system substrate-binding protein